MNAYDLATSLEALIKDGRIVFSMDVVDMLRQQADRIAELEKELVRFADALGKERQLNKSAEPMAWIINGKLFEEYFRTSELDNIIPLYTTPQTKPRLSNEEIISEWIGNDKNYYNFARAIEDKHGIC